MTRLRSLTLALLLVLLTGAVPVQAALVWEPAGPVAPTGGMSAVVVDPADPRVVWVAGGGSVWVSDDAGNSWNLVLQLSGMTRADRSESFDDAGDGSGDVDDDDDAEEESDERVPLGLDDLVFTSDRNAETGSDAVQGRSARQIATQLEGRVGKSITRLRVIGDRLYVCTGRGLWYLDRNTRSLGSGVELRLGRRGAVLDVASGAGTIWVATSRGLVSSTLDGTSTPVAGVLGSTSVRVLISAGARVYAAAASGLWVFDTTGWQRTGLAAGARVITDLRRMADQDGEPGDRLVAAVGSEVWRIRCPVQGRCERQGIERLPDAQRLAVGRSGVLWAVGSTGPWRRTGRRVVGDWQPRGRGLGDARLSDVATCSEGMARAWVVGRGGAARLVTERARVWSKRARERASQVLAGRPSAWDTLRAAERVRHADLEAIGALRAQMGMAWAAPELQFRYRNITERLEDRLWIPVLEQRILDAVKIIPEYNEFRLMATWDLYPAMWALLDLSSSYGGATIRSETKRAQRDRIRVRKKVLPTYKAWLREEIRAATSRSRNLRAVLKRELTRQRLLADLHVYTGGWFPVGPPMHATESNQAIKGTEP